MKKAITICLLFLIMAGLSGCNYMAIGMKESNTSAKMTGSYTSLTGTKEGKITVADGETVEVAVNIVTKKGSIDVTIYRDTDNYSYEGRNIPTSDFTVTLSEPGDYKIKVEALKHKGSYSFVWKNK